MALRSQLPSHQTLIPTEMNHSHLEKEGLVVVLGVRKFHAYLYGQKFAIYSDHQPLHRLISETGGVPVMADSQIQRWLDKYRLLGSHTALREAEKSAALSR